MGDGVYKINSRQKDPDKGNSVLFGRLNGVGEGDGQAEGTIRPRVIRI